MNRAGKITLPYAFCLFCGVLAIVLLMAGLVAVLALRDIRAARPAQADAALGAALSPAFDRVTGHFSPAIDQLQSTRRWLEAGIFPEHAVHEWPAILLPALSPLAPLRSLCLIRSDGAVWGLDRSVDGWVARYAESDSEAVVRSRWNRDGLRLDGAATPPNADGESDFEWYRQSLAATTPGGAEALRVTMRESGARVALVAPVAYPGSQTASLVFMVDCSALIESLRALPSDSVRIELDPGGEDVGRIQDPQTLALLQEQALPGSAIPGLASLLNVDNPVERRMWYRARAIDLGGAATWWLVAAVDESDLPLPALPLDRYLALSLALGLLGAAGIALLLGRRITRPLRQVAARARNIQVLDEHYLPWPESRFTEVNLLTVALEDIYESAVEHLDYHDAPLVVWAQPDSAPDDQTIVVDAVRHVVNIPRGSAPPLQDEPPAPSPHDVIPVRESMPAVQIQALLGTRREVRRLQGQLSGAREELKSTNSRYEEAQSRMRRQRDCLRALHAVLQREGAVSPSVLAQVLGMLEAARVSLWIAGDRKRVFRLRLSTDGAERERHVLEASLRCRALLEQEACVAVHDPRQDTRLDGLIAHAFRGARTGSMLLAPLKLGGYVLGFLLVEHGDRLWRWKSDEELFLTSVAAQGAGVLWQQLRQRARQQGKPAVGPLVTAKVGARNGNGHGNGKPNGHGNHGQNGARDGGGVGRPNALHYLAGVRRAESEFYWETDIAGCITRLEGDVHSIYGRTVEELVGQPITFLSETGRGSADIDQLSALLGGARCMGYETRHIAADGAQVDLAIVAEVIRDANDRVIGARGTARCTAVTVGI